MQGPIPIIDNVHGTPEQIKEQTLAQMRWQSEHDAERKREQEARRPFSPFFPGLYTDPPIFNL